MPSIAAIGEDEKNVWTARCGRPIVRSSNTDNAVMLLRDGPVNQCQSVVGAREAKPDDARQTFTEDLVSCPTPTRVEWGPKLWAATYPTIMISGPSQL